MNQLKVDDDTALSGKNERKNISQNVVNEFLFHQSVVQNTYTLNTQIYIKTGHRSL